MKSVGQIVDVSACAPVSTVSSRIAPRRSAWLRFAPRRNGGRKHRLTPGQVQAARDLRAAGRSVKEIGQLLGNGKPVSRQTVYRALGMLAS